MRENLVPLQDKDRSSSVRVASMLALMDSTGTISQELLPVNETESEQILSQVQVQQPISPLLPDHLLLSLKSRRCEVFFSKKNNKSDLSPRSHSDPYPFTKKKVEKHTPPLLESTTLVIQSFLFFLLLYSSLSIQSPVVPALLRGACLA